MTILINTAFTKDVPLSAHISKYHFTYISFYKIDIIEILYF